ncbi:MAG: hypothetical protein Q9213_002174 [Squamulea squamosa]
MGTATAWYDISDLPPTVPSPVAVPLEIFVSKNLTSSRGTQMEDFRGPELAQYLYPWLNIAETFVTAAPRKWSYILTATTDQQLSNQYIAIKGALGVLGLDIFLVGDFFPKADAQFNIVNALTGLGTILSVVSGFVPFIGPGIAAIGAILPTIGTFLSDSAAAKEDPLVSQKEFAPRVRKLYNNYVSALDDAATSLFTGKSVQTDNSSFNIADMMSQGAWVNSSALTRLTGIENNLTIEILSRSVNALWKTPPSNKIWVLYVQLDDDLNSNSSCVNGPDSGYVDYPWGGDLLEQKLGVKLSWVTEASAKSYRLAKANGTINPFNVTGQIGTQTFLSEAVRDNGTNILLVNQAGRYPGSWTLPVCNASRWGTAWNWDYTSYDYKHADDFALVSADYRTSQRQQTHPPCLYGENGSETAAWAIAAGLQDFDTFHERCKNALRRKSFQWPAGVNEVIYTGSSNYTVKKPGT